jgi:hypothetical protein
MQIYLIAMFRIISKDSKLYLEITSKYTKTLNHTSNKKTCCFFNHTNNNTHTIDLVLLISGKQNVKGTVSECTVRQNKLFGDSTSLHLFIFIAIVFYDKVA